MKKTILLTLILALGLAVKIAKADFVFGKPTNLGSTFNTTSGDVSPLISYDGLSLYFSSDRYGGIGDNDIYVVTRKTSEQIPEGYWSTPINLGPAVNSSSSDSDPSISADGLALYFGSYRSGGFGAADLYVSTRETIGGPWGQAEDLGMVVNSPSGDWAPTISDDGLTLFFGSDRPGGSGGWDLWVTTRRTTYDPWEKPENLGPTVNSSSLERGPSISVDGLALFFISNRAGGSGYIDLWLSMRPTKNDPWGTSVNLGSTVNSSAYEVSPHISPDGRILLFASNRPGGSGRQDLWQSPVIPIVDLNSDGIVDAEDLSIVVDNWGTDNSLCDIGPMPWGDGVVDVQDLIVLAEYLFEEIPLVE